MNFIKAHINRAAQAIKSYKENNDGVAAVEFVLIAPVLIFLYIGLYEISIAFTVNGAVNRSSEVAASFPTFEEDLDDQKISNIMTAAAATLDYPGFDIEKLAIKIYSIEQQTALATSRRFVGQAIYEGADAQNILTDRDIAEFQGNLSALEAGDGFIVADVSYLYTPILSDVYVKQVTLTDGKLLNPRNNQGQALPIATTTPVIDRASLSCTQLDGVFDCSNGPVALP